MKFNIWLENNKLTRKSFLIIGSLLILSISINLVLSYGLIKKEQIIIIQPMFQNKSIEVNKNILTKSYAESYAISVALLLGNLTKDNADLILSNLAPNMLPESYHDLANFVQQEIDHLKRSNTTISFTPIKAEFKPEHNTVIVTGISKIIAITGESIHNYGSFEIGMIINNYQTLINKINYKSDVSNNK